MLFANALTPDVYCRFHALAGFPRYDPVDVAAALKGTLYSVVAYEEDEPVAIGRIVGDGRVTFFIKDIIVHPDYQGHQYGRKIMEHLLQYIERKGCPGAYVGLMATCGTEPFYERFGFARRPNELHGAGMIQFLKGDAT